MADEGTENPVAEQAQAEETPTEQTTAAVEQSADQPTEPTEPQQATEQPTEQSEQSQEQTEQAEQSAEQTEQSNEQEITEQTGEAEQKADGEAPAKDTQEESAGDAVTQEQNQETPAEQTEAPTEQTEASAEQTTQESTEQSDEKTADTEGPPAEATEAPVEQTQEAPVEQAEETPVEQAEETPAEQAQEATTEEAPAEPAIEAQEEQKEDEVKPEPESAVQQDATPAPRMAAQSHLSEMEQEAEPAPRQTQQTHASEAKPDGPAVGQVAASTTPVPTDQQEPEVDPQAPSPTPRGHAENTATCTVKFVLMPSAQVYTERCGLDQTLLELKQHLSNELKVPASVIILTHDGKETTDSEVLPDLGVGPNGTVQLEILSGDPGNYPIKSLKKRVDYQMPDVITVRVFTETNEVKDVVVEIERAMRKKPFLGGYRHKKNGVEYHHASAQTMQKPRPPSNVEKYCRDTQTSQQKHEVQQTTNNMATQMTKIGVYVSNLPDKLIVPGKYTTADDYKKNVFNRVLTIQKYYRRWLAKRYVERVREDKARRYEWERQEELKKKKEKEDRIKREFERRMNPKSQEDFDLLYHALEKWRQEELERINAELTGAERKAALCQLLDQETQLIASIGRHKLDADDENRTKAIQGFLEKAASPKKWKGRDGKTTEMDTPYTIRAQELRDIYNSINMKYLTQDERLDVLLTLKHTVKEHDSKLTQEIIELIDREADLLMRGVKESNLDGLRRRISTLFLQYIKTPTFNPEAARLLKVPQDPSVLRKDIYFCQSCNQYKPSTEFQLSSNSSSVGRCRKCNKIDNDARVRQDYSHYRYMVKALRRSEEGYADGSQIAYLLQEGDLRYLVENVWNSQSILSAWEDLYDLVLVRWDKHTEWSPWNCILITKEEAASHDKLENLDEAYGKTLIHKVKHKHTLARNYFSRLPGMAEFMRTRGSSGKAMANGPSVSGTAVPVAPVQ